MYLPSWLVSELVVADTSPLIFLDGVGCLGLLSALYGRILVPDAVAQEIADGLALGLPGPVLLALPWVSVMPSGEDKRVTEHRLSSHLGAGERAALTLALATSGAAVLMDERDGRTVAADLGLSRVGTLGILVRAKRIGLLPAVAPVLDRLDTLHFRVDPGLRLQVLAAAGE